jgi:hypothetical protein
MDHTASKGAGTEISPAILRELGDVRSIRTATSSQESSLLLLSLCSVPPNHQTPNAVDDDGEKEEYAAVDGTVLVEVENRHRLFMAVLDLDVEGDNTNADERLQLLKSSKMVVIQDGWIILAMLLHVLCAMEHRRSSRPNEKGRLLML